MRQPSATNRHGGLRSVSASKLRRYGVGATLIAATTIAGLLAPASLAGPLDQDQVDRDAMWLVHVDIEAALRCAISAAERSLSPAGPVPAVLSSIAVNLDGDEVVISARRAAGEVATAVRELRTFSKSMTVAFDGPASRVQFGGR